MICRAWCVRSLRSLEYPCRHTHTHTHQTGSFAEMWVKVHFQISINHSIIHRVKTLRPAVFSRTRPLDIRRPNSPPMPWCHQHAQLLYTVNYMLRRRAICIHLSIARIALRAFWWMLVCLVSILFLQML